MKTFLSPNFVQEEVTSDDFVIASIAWGFTLGFGWLTVSSAIAQTAKTWRRYGSRSIHNTYIWMIWLEVIVCIIFSVICWLYLRGNIAPSFAFYFTILTTWALQVQFLLQIIINRCSILLPDKRAARRLKFYVALLITAINISVYCIWVPARLQISERYIHINEFWDRTEKVIYLLVDAALNLYFIIIVKRNLVANGLKKYKRLTNFNIFIIGFSLSMDILIISMMSLKNTFVYMQFHPLAYMVKLNIEMTMADLIGKIAKKQERLPTYHSSFNRRPAVGSRMPSFGNSFGNSFGSRNNTVQPLPPSRNAVPFRVWQSSVSAGMDSAAVSRRASMNPPANELTFVTVPDDPVWNTAGMTSPDGPNTSDTPMELYMVKEVTVESDVVRRSTFAPNGSEGSVGNNWGRASPASVSGRDRVDDRATGRETPPPVIWDGSPQVSTTIAIGRKID
ncbi:hypothetical protein KVR01_012926 [Diaporthe batatas]|uniref:uncharacterized protein n=1 Tax=Diaporthe batatas TaxID=748121 RepID=UPI001D04C46C|nr:uncharacterized protein KVR01_012926 [Diaporthe batatas]KAG8157218.1 hypothetical protein KVR01_012926 [Diaporthe batatas]